MLATAVYVADSGNNRMVKYDTPDNWPTECNFTDNSVSHADQAISPPGSQFIGQASGQAIKANQGGNPAPRALCPSP